MATNALSIDQIKFKANNAWNGLDEVRLYNGTDALYCKEGVTTGLLMQGNQLKIVNVTWNAGVPAVTVKGYIDAQGDYHSLYKSDGTSASTSLQTLRESVNNSALKTQAIKNITRSGTTFTATRCDDTTFTFTQQDNNTTYSNATTSTAGLMSATDKSKVNGLNNLSVSVWSSVPNAAQLNIPMLSGGKTLKIYFKHGTGTSIALE